MNKRQQGMTENNSIQKNTIKQAFISSLPVMAGYIVLGMGFGILLQDKGYTWPWALLMGVTIYAGSMQYVAVDLLAAGASLISVTLMTIMVQIRHLFYGITLLKKYEKAGKYKPYMIFGLTDETFSLVSRPELPENVDEFKYYFYLTMMNHSYWIIGDVLGVILGSSFAFNSRGVDFAMTALFVVIFVSILVSSVVFGIWPITNVWLRTLIHLVLLPLIVGVTYEFNRWVGRHVQESALAKVLTAPGMWLQNFTTNEPDDSMIEVAIRSIELVLPSEKGKDEW